MTYLYGDSTPSTLQVNFVEFLRDCLDFCVQVLLAGEGLQRGAERGAAFRRAASADTERLERVGSAVAQAVKSVPTPEGDTPTARCAAAIVRATADLVKSEIEQVNSTLQGELAKLDALAAREREGCVKALEALLLRHDLPDTTLSLTVQAHGGTRYVARLRAFTASGVNATLDLDIPPANLYGQIVRLDRVVERLEVQAPDVGGWRHKETRLRPQRLEKLHMTELTLAGTESSMRLRANADGGGAGFDVLLRAEAPRVQLIRVGERDATPETAFAVSDADAASLLSLYEKLDPPARALAQYRKALVDVSLDDRPLRDHENPTVLVARLIAAMSPVAREIAQRSPSPTELVLKRLLSDSRREEIFVTKAELKKKLDPLPPTLRSLFDPLGLNVENSAIPAAMPVRQEAPELSRSSPQQGSE